ncbi:MAG TPA: hypothetical protein VFT67_03185 [Jatrophihabitantaceae bacterium]|nr:hypothetical protein [Jatrophihabitantaceae bacterium]
MAFVVVAVVVLALACAAWVDHRDRKRRRRRRGAGEMIGNRRQRMLGSRSAGERGAPTTEAWNPGARERMREQSFGDY